MKAWRIPAFGIGKLSLDEVPAPQPAPGQVVVDVHAVSLNYRDLMTVKGLYNPRLQPNRIPCSDGAGIIAAIGQGVTQVAVGDRVAGTFFQQWLDGDPSPEKFKGALGGDIDGTLAQQIVLQEDGVVKFPEHLGFEEAATLPCAGVTAWNAVVTAARVSRATPCSSRAQVASPASLCSSRSASARESSAPRRAPTSCAAPRNWAWMLATTTATTRNGHAGPSARRADRASTSPSKSAAQAHSNNPWQPPAPGASSPRSASSPAASSPLTITPILHKMLQIRGIYVGSRQHFVEMNRAVEQTGLRPVIDRVFSFGEAPEAFTTMENASHFGKIVISGEDSLTFPKMEPVKSAGTAKRW